MSGRVAMAWVVVAGALAAVYLAVSGSPGGARDPGAEATRVALGFDPARVTALRFEAGGSIVIERDTESASGWSMVWKAGGENRRWGAREQAVRGFLRALVSEGVEARGGDGAASTAGGGSVVIALSDGSEIGLSLGDGGVGGRVAATLSQDGRERSVWVSRTLAGLAERGSLLAWRDAGLMAGSARATRLVIEGGGSSVTLSRARGRWMVSAPVEARGDEALAEEALGRVRGLVAESFVDGDVGGVARLDEPVARMVIEAERREVAGDTYERVVTRRTLEIGGEADAGASTRFVRASAQVVREGEVEREYGPVLGVMSVEGLGGVTAQAEAYISRVPVGVPAGDVGVVALAGADGEERARFVRDRRGWRRGARSGAAGATEAEAAGLDALLAMLCTDGMERVEALGGDSAIEGALGEVRLETAGGGVIAVLEFGGADGEPVVRDGGVFWIGGGERGAAVLGWVRGVVRD